MIAAKSAVYWFVITTDSWDCRQVIDPAGGGGMDVDWRQTFETPDKLQNSIRRGRGRGEKEAKGTRDIPALLAECGDTAEQ